MSLLDISLQVFHLSLQLVGGLHVLLEVPLCQLDPVLSLSQGSLHMQAGVESLTPRQLWWARCALNLPQPAMLVPSGRQLHGGVSSTLLFSL